MENRQCESHHCIEVVADYRLKQMRLIHKQGYTPDEIEDFR